MGFVFEVNKWDLFATRFKGFLLAWGNDFVNSLNILYMSS